MSHPTDAEREREAIEVLERCVAAARAGDRAALAACYADEVVWLDDGARHEGAAAAAERHLSLGSALAWDPPQQKGARAVLRFTRPGGEPTRDRGAVVVEVRRGRIVFAAAAP